MIKLPATTLAMGTYMGAPDVCKTPMPPPVGTVPIPYPNAAMVPASSDTVNKVLIENMDVVVEGTKVPNSNGDEAGVTGGVSSGSNMKEVAPKLFSSTVIAKGKKMVFLTSVSAHNGASANCPVGACVVPSQAKVLIGF